jgi:hypothetical protein
MLSVLCYMRLIFGSPVLFFDDTGQCQPPGNRPPLLAGAGPGPTMLRRFVQVHCNYIPIFSKTCEEHLVHVLMVLETLCHHKLFAKASKYQFDWSAVGFLWHVIFEHSAKTLSCS